MGTALIQWEKTPYSTPNSDVVADVCDTGGKTHRLRAHRAGKGARLFYATIDGNRLAGAFHTLDAACAAAARVYRDTIHNAPCLACAKGFPMTHGRHYNGIGNDIGPCTKPETHSLQVGMNAAIYAAFEFGFRCAEKGKSLQEATALFNNTMKG